ncbi:uncharacterized protein LOC123402557 [Hordeum vulgare subsp. vulgare]|uniref:uncharacterized protein LOC123402557 n=1 Tax=Hordeum vulgare subsp. vulgare TaxID=112509 RepID=UPI001D1A387F|nr:uncharacterized protein LOC123402557 [Hordeum vulgare subsp. vulgare]
MYIKIETMRLDWYSKPENQKVIRADMYQGLVDTVVAGESRGDRIGKRIVLPRTFPGGDRDMQRRFLNAMAIVQRSGKPDYFITMTCNPYWEEITEELLPGQMPQDRPDLVARLHLPNMHTVAFKACENVEDVVARPSSSKSMLTEYFEMNRKFPVARNLLYREFPEHYRWIPEKKVAE